MLCVALAVLELVHPAFSDGAVADAVTPLWLPLHLALMVGYALLAVLLWLTATTRLSRLAVVVFAVLNSVFLAIDGLVIGLRAPVDPGSADALWASPAATILADASGAMWCASLLALVADRDRAPLSRAAMVLLALTWVTFVGAAFGVPVFVSRGLAVAVGAWQVYRSGTSALASALLAFGAVLRQHVGPEAALGLLCVAAALAPTRRTG